MRKPALHAFAASASVVALVPALPVQTASAAPTLVYPGMEIHQDDHLCTLGYVDPGQKIAFTAGHCRGRGAVTDKAGNAIGHLATFRDNIRNGSTVAINQPISDYEAIVLDNVPANNILPGGRPLVSVPGLTVQPGQNVCHFGVITGETCGTVDKVNNGWFTMSQGVHSQHGDSGGPVYLAPLGGPGQIVGIFNSMWGPSPAAVSWGSASAEVHEDMAAQSIRH